MMESRIREGDDDNDVLFWEPLLSVKTTKTKQKLAEIPGNESPRIGRGGERKLQVLRWGAAYYFQFIRELRFWRPVR